MMLLCCWPRVGGLDWLCGTLLCSLSDLAVAFPVLRCQLGAADVFSRSVASPTEKHHILVRHHTRHEGAKIGGADLCTGDRKGRKTLGGETRKVGGCYRMPLILRSCTE